MPGAREAELAANLARVEERVTRACDAAGRARADVTLIVVTKTYPAEDVRRLAALGVRHVAENRDQEAAAKAAACADLPLNWHFVGQLQTNKVRSVTSYARCVHSVDRVRLVHALSSAVVNAGRPPLDCLVQVALEKKPGDSGGRGGVAPEGVEELVTALAGAPGLRAAGLMTVAPLSGRYAGEPAAAFERLWEMSRDLRARHPAANMVSAGMSADLEQAIAAGATHVRVGSAVLGVRPTLG
ncbi:YggS family pyridoxal phosphate-dependent enzyme [Streptomyces marincola]|uniref:YggS family pyridoxal phosphate-dependent enzyme n=1 Tax=Streptomyces marincola TaxID=2878388 RepID=UPI0021004483|nr:YggS family pyridoxal phosphate-dependent enzyme [Streptomyces marincola]